MAILAIEASTSVCSVALSHSQNIFTQTETTQRQQALRLLPMIEAVLQSAGLHLSDLESIALSNGPGSFTGLRLVLGVVQGLAYAQHLPIIPISSLAVIAQTAYEAQQFKKIIVLIDAHMGEVYQGMYCLNEKNCMEKVSEDALLLPENFTMPTEKDWMVVGNAVDVYPELLNKITEENCWRDYLPSAQALLNLAEKNNIQSENVFNVLPNYLRNEQAWKTHDKQITE